MNENKVDDVDNKDSLSDLIFIIVIIASLLNFIYISYNNFQIMNKPPKWGQIAFKTNEEENKWKEDREIKLKKAEKAEASLKQNKGISRFIALACMIGTIIAFAAEKDKKKKKILKPLLLIILNVILLL